MVKSISISLAVKCQLLFGLAVLVIIAGALAVPWQRMEQLAGQQNVKAARMLADASFRQVHLQAPSSTPADTITLVPMGSPGTSTSSPATSPATHWNDVSLIDIPDYPPPRIVTLLSRDDDLAGEDTFARDALELFHNRPKETELGKVVTVQQDKDKVRLYKYAAAVRLDKSCLACHTPWTGWLRSDTQPRAATESATAMAASNGSGTATPPLSPSQNDSRTSRADKPPVPSLAAWPLVAIVRVDLPWQIDDNQILLNRIVLVVSGIVGGTLAVVVFYLITSRLILQPVRVLKNTAEKVARGDLNIRSAISTGDEFQQLSETFNKMLATLSASQTQLESTNRSLDTRVGELAQSNVDLYEANRLKSEFLANVSHELRTPLNAIIGFADLLVANPITADPKIARWTDNIKSSAHQLLDLINDLLDLAKIEAGKLILREEKVSVPDTCEAILNFMKPLAAKKNIDLAFEAEPQMPLIATDLGRFQQILYNFLSNAIKFTPNDGKVLIKAAAERPQTNTSALPGAGEATLFGVAVAPESASRPPDPEYVRIAITDTGPGIAPEFQHQIFEKFRQIDGSVTRQHSGTGLGLAISRELANMLGGRIELHSELGKGATFSILLPIEPRHRAPEIHA